MSAAVPTVPEAVKVTGLPVSEPEVAVKVLLLVPAVGPSVQSPTVAMPDTSVATVAGPLIEPPPPVTAKVTITPCTELTPSVTLTEGRVPTAVPAIALCVSTELAAMVVPEPAPSVTPPEVTRVSPGAVNCSVYVPDGPVIDRLVNVATPLAMVVAVAVPPSVAPAGPEAIVTVTSTPPCATEFPAPSRTWTTGCCAKATPLAPAADGWVARPSRAAAPALRAIVPDTTGVRPEDEKVRVYPPTGPLIARLLKTAFPDAFVVTVVVPTSAPPPDVMLAVTCTPATETGLPLPSRICTAGCCARATPLDAADDGWVMMASWVGAPAPRMIAVEVAPVTPGELKPRL